MRQTQKILSAVAMIAVLTATSFDNAPARERTPHSIKIDAARIVAEEARSAGIPVDLALAVAKVESNFDCSVVGSAGERGVMQIKPRTARGIGFRGTASELGTCRMGAKYGVKYLKEALRVAKGDKCRAAALYNGGLGSGYKRTTQAYCAMVLNNARYHDGNVVAAVVSTVRRK